MSDTIATTPRPTRISKAPSQKFSLDTWAVIVALAVSARRLARPDQTHPVVTSGVQVSGPCAGVLVPGLL